jgi:hypothetical protein
MNILGAIIEALRGCLFVVDGDIPPFLEALYSTTREGWVNHNGLMVF